MRDLPPFGAATIVGLLLVVAVAAGARAWYVAVGADQGALAPALRVQGDPQQPIPAPPPDGRAPAGLEPFAQNVAEHNWFAGPAPLAAKDEETAHVAPGYPWLFGLIARYHDDPARVARWAQVALGALTAGAFFLFARWAFASTATATVAGLLCALHPFGVLATAELADGVLAGFLLAAALALGTRAGQVGGAVTSLLFGLSLAGLAMTRAALLPFTLIAFVWFLGRCRHARWGWFAALLAFLGYANGLAPWAVRNYRVFGEPVPIASSTYLHLWMGNCPQATGGPLDDAGLRDTLPPQRLQQLLDEPNQVRRYGQLSAEVLGSINDDPAGTVGRRLTAGQAFFLGERWLRNQELVAVHEGESVAEPPAWLAADAELILRSALLGTLLLAFLGWRWSAAWAWHGRLAALAVVWVPVPYLLSHAAALSGPRLPLDGVLLCYAAYALTHLGAGRRPAAVADGPDGARLQ